MPSSGPSFDRWCLFGAALVYATAAWFGVGYHGEDEYHQVVLNAQYLCGDVDLTCMPPDFHARWRSMVLPVIAAAVFSTCGNVGITDPFTWTLALRLFTALVALWIIRGSIRMIQRTLAPTLHKAFALLSYFLWFVPVLSIRFTGEAWSGLLLLRGLATILDEQRRRRYAAAGIWFGAAMLFRFAVAMVPFGIVLWLVFIERASRRNVLQFIGAAASVLLFGVIIDSLAYGEPVSALWNYTLAGLRGGEAWRHTQLPWYHHLLFIAKYAVLPLGLSMLMAFGVLLLLRPQHVLIWSLIPFLIAPSILEVKELRSLFPIAPLMPWMLIAAWEALHQRWPQIMERTIWLRMGFILALINALALLVGISTPAGNGRVKLALAIHERYGQEAVHIDHMGDWRQWIPPFFLAPGSTEAFTDKVIVDPKLDGPNHLVIAKRSLKMDRVSILEPIAVATPAWTDHLLGWYMLEDDHDPLVLYRITQQTSGH